MKWILNKPEKKCNWLKVKAVMKVIDGIQWRLFNGETV